MSAADTETTATDTENIVCDKYGVNLKKHPIKDYYTIDFRIANPTYDVSTITTLKLYDLLFQLNTDVFEDMKILDEDDDEEEIILYFKPFGTGMGIKKKYLFLRTTLDDKSPKLQILANSVVASPQLVEGYDMMYNEFFILDMDISNIHDVSFKCKFKISITDDLPIFMGNLLGMLMKKMFLNLKQFIENIE